MPRILIIDDEEMIRMMLKDILEAEGYDIAEAPDGQSGIDQYARQQFDLIITDIMMPQKDGFETIVELKRSHPNAKIVALTGFGLHNLPVAYDLGAARVYEKPVNPAELKQAIKELLEE